MARQDHRQLEGLRQRHYNATVEAVIRIHDELMILRLKPDAPLSPSRPGQYTQIGIGSWEPPVAPAAASAGGDDSTAAAGQATSLPPDKLLQGYLSLSCSIVDADGGIISREQEATHEFYIALDRSPLTTRLFTLSPGRRLWVCPEPAGEYTLDPVAPGDDVLFCATGTGEAPHNRMLAELLRRDHPGRIASLLSCRHRADMGYRKIHESLAQRFPRYRYHAFATREGGGGGHIQDRIASGAMAEAIGFSLDPHRVHVFLCGNFAMVGRPSYESDRVIYPSPLGVIEVLETRFGFQADRPAQPGNIHFE